LGDRSLFLARIAITATFVALVGLLVGIVDVGVRVYDFAPEISYLARSVVVAAVVAAAVVGLLAAALARQMTEAIAAGAVLAWLMTASSLVPAVASSLAGFVAASGFVFSVGRCARRLSAIAALIVNGTVFITAMLWLSSRLLIGLWPIFNVCAAVTVGMTAVLVGMPIFRWLGRGFRHLWESAEVR
jgi:hypothetical protein